MKKNPLLLALALLGFGCQSGDHQHDHDHDAAAASADSVAAESGNFGQVIEADQAISMDSLKALMALNSKVENVKVEGTVAEVCQKKGCWMTMQQAGADGMRVTFRDYGFFVPKNCSGKSAVIQGTAFLDTTSVEDLRHYAEDEGLSKEEIEKITEAKIELAFEADGVIIR